MIERLPPCAVCSGVTTFWANPCGDWLYDRCRDCGHVQLRKQPSQQELQRYYDGIYQYSEEGLAVAVAHRYIHVVEEALALSEAPDRRILEVGCNTGTLLMALRSRGWQVGGTELGNQFRIVAESRGLDVRRSLNDWVGERFSVIVCFHVLEHMLDTAAELRAMHRLLYPGGVLAMKTPNAQCLAARLFPAEWEWSSPPAHLRLFTRHSLCRCVEAAGFDILRVVSERGNARPLPFQGLRAVAMRLRGRTRRFVPGLDPRHVPVAHEPWYRALERLGMVVGALGVPLIPLLQRLDLLPELTMLARVAAERMDARTPDGAEKPQGVQRFPPRLPS